MKISELMAKLQAEMIEHGDIEVLEGNGYHAIDGTYLLEVENDDDFPKDWNMPKGTKVCLLNYG